MSVDELRAFYDLCERLVLFEAVNATYREGGGKRSDNTLRRHHLEWLLCTGRWVELGLQKADVEERYYGTKLRGTAKALDDAKMRLGVTGSEQPQSKLTERLRNPLYRLHIERLINLAETIRSCVWDPQYSAEAYQGTGQPFKVRDHDWGLSPLFWVSLVTPDFEEKELWSPLLPSLKDHTIASPFWTTLAELKNRAQRLSQRTEAAARVLSDSDQTFGETWSAISRFHDWTGVHSRTSRFPGLNDDDRPPYSPATARKVLEVFGEEGSFIYQEQWVVVGLLNQMNQDLMPERFDRIIAEGKCDFCRDM